MHARSPVLWMPVLLACGCSKALDYDDIGFQPPSEAMDASISDGAPDSSTQDARTDGGGSSDSGDAKACVPEEKSCEADNVVRCNASGTAWTVSETCDHGCLGGVCKEPSCTPDCTGKLCGDDGCEGTCGTCTGVQEECVGGACVCQPACAGKDCGADGCGGNCGQCNLTSSYCGSTQTCISCESAVCGACDEIEVSDIIYYSGPIGGDHAINQLRAEVLTWPITADLEISIDGPSPCFVLHHFPGQSWGTTSNGYSDGAAQVACFHSIDRGGIMCETYEWYSPDHNICRTMNWPADRPVAHFFVSAIDQKRTPIKYYASWPYNEPIPNYNSSNVGTGMVERACQ